MHNWFTQSDLKYLFVFRNKIFAYPHAFIQIVCTHIILMQTFNCCSFQRVLDKKLLFNIRNVFGNKTYTFNAMK